jgi:hypothetical protein
MRPRRPSQEVTSGTLFDSTQLTEPRTWSANQINGSSWREWWTIDRPADCIGVWFGPDASDDAAPGFSGFPTPSPFPVPGTGTPGVTGYPPFPGYPVPVPVPGVFRVFPGFGVRDRTWVRGRAEPPTGLGVPEPLFFLPFLKTGNPGARGPPNPFSGLRESSGKR